MSDMSISVEPIHGCTGKFRFSNANRAWKVANRMSRRDKGTGETPAQAYRCQFCGRWHVGHKERR